MTQTTAPYFIDLPMPELTFNKNAKNYVAIYDVVTSEHSFVSCNPDDLVDPVATMARFNASAAKQVGVDRLSIILKSITKSHLDFVTSPPRDNTHLDRLRVHAYLLTQLAGHPFLMVVNAPQGVRLFQVPAKTPKRFNKWVYSKGKQAILNIANELVAAAPELFRELMGRDGESVRLH